MNLSFFPKQQEAADILSKGDAEFVLYGGAMGGGKTIFALLYTLVLCRIYPGSRWCVVRADMEKLRTTTIPSLQWIGPSGQLKQSPWEYTHPNGSVILFKSENYERDKELNWMKGLEVNGFILEEINELQEQTLNLAFSRAGRWKLKTGYQPKPMMFGTCNPTQGWVKERIYDKWQNDTLPDGWVYIPAKITDNPHLDPEYIKRLKNMPRYEYEVYVNGRWDVQLKIGGEFWKSFELEQHVRPVSVNIENTIHVSVDNNVYPYIAVSFWQVKKNDQDSWDIKQVHEICAKDPNNTASKAGLLVCNWLMEIGYNQPVFLYGDPTTQNRNTIDDDKKSFLDKFILSIQKSFTVQNRMMRSTPSVSVSGDFINAIYEENWGGMSITIGENCRNSISDYIELKQDKDGGTLKKRITDPKTKVSYEPVGHLSDTKKDFLVSLFNTEFLKFFNRFSDYKLHYNKPRDSYVRGGI